MQIFNEMLPLQEFLTSGDLDFHSLLGFRNRIGDQSMFLPQRFKMIPKNKEPVGYKRINGHQQFLEWGYMN
jgi:hypothetical protein